MITIKKYIYISNILKCNLFLWRRSWIFSSYYSSLQCHMILRNHSASFETENVCKKCFTVTVDQFNAFLAKQKYGVRCLAQGSHLSCGQFLPEPRFEPTTSGYKSNALLEPRLPSWLMYLTISCIDLLVIIAIKACSSHKTEVCVMTV